MYCKVKDTLIYYEEYGTGKNTILILPGWGDARKTFYHIINSLKNYFHIIILDYPNFGNSDSITYEMTIYDYAKLVCSFLEINSIKEPIIIAHSFGGRITALLNSYYKIKIKKIIFFDVAGIKRRKKVLILIKEKLYKLLKKITNFLFPKKKNKINNFLIKIFASSDYKNIPSYLHKTFQNIINEDLTDYYKKIKVETLIIWGDKDNDTPLKDAYLLNRIISNSGLIIYKNAGHFSYLDRIYNTDRILKVFLKKDMD